jgi:hypothetical protein
MKLSDLSISRKIGLLVLLMGIAAGTIAAVGIPAHAKKWRARPWTYASMSARSAG